MRTLLLAAMAGLLSAQTYQIQTIAGTNSPLENISAVQAGFASLEGIAVDLAGNVYVADAGDHRVRRITPGGLIQTIAGDGTAGYRGDGGAAIGARLNTPYGLATDRTGNVYVADLGNGRVRRIGIDGVITTVAGGGTKEPQPQFSANAVRASEAKLKAPRNVAVDALGNVYVSDFDDHRVVRITPDGWLYTAAQAGLKNPTALALDANGRLYIADAGNKRIVKLEGGALQPATSTGHAYSNQVLFYPVTGMAIDFDGNLFALEGGVRNLRRISPANQIVEYSWGGRDVAVDSLRRIYLTDGGTNGGLVRRMSNQGVEVIAGGAGFRFAGDQGPAAQARLNAPSGVAMDAQGNLYIADTLNHRVRRVTAGTRAITTIAGTGEAGYSGDAGLAVNAKLRSPVGIAVDERGYVYVSDSGNHAIRRITPGGVIETVVGNGAPGMSATQLNRPMGIALDGQLGLIVADSGNNRVVQAGIGSTLRTLAQGTEANKMKRPTDVAPDVAGQAIYIADPEAKCLFKLTSAALEPVTHERLFEPTTVAFDASDGTLVVGDTVRQQVIRMGLDSSFVVLAGTGAAGFNGDLANAEEAELNRPVDVVIASGTGEIVIADADNHRVRKLTKGSAPVGQPPILGDESVTVRGLVSAADGNPAPVVAGALMTLRGTNFRSPAVRFDGVEATLTGTSTADQVTFVVPIEMANRPRATLELRSGGVARYQQMVEIAEAAPVIFTQPDGTAVALNQDQTVNSSGNPAIAGEIVTIYVTGTGLWRGQETARASIGGAEAEVVFAGPAPGLVGLTQWNLRVPTWLPAGPAGVKVFTGGFASSSSSPISVR